MKKNIRILFLSIFTLLLSSCGQDTTQLAKDEFSKYYNDMEEVALIHNNYIYTETSELNLESLVDNETPNNGVLIKNDKLLFSTSEEVSIFNFTLNIYESNLKGEYIKLIFSKEGFKTNPKAYAYDDKFYIEHHLENALNQNSKCIDMYSINGNFYENIASGKDCKLSDYFHSEEQSRYSIEVIENTLPKEHGKFIITDSETGVVNTIDDNYLRNTIYIESMEKFNYGPERFDISKGHVLLTYGIGAGDGWNYSHLVFEYNFELNMLEYKLLAFPYDSVPIEIIYID